MPTDPTQTITIDGNSLTNEAVEAVVRQHAKPVLTPEAREAVQRAADFVRNLSASKLRVYGVNTGFGTFVDHEINLRQAAQLSRNLVLSHAVGVGRPFSREVVRAAMLIRANTLAHGHSGVRPAIIDTLLQMISEDVTPYVPSQGSLGSSGDLAPLAHMALVLSNDPGTNPDEHSGRAWHDGQLKTGAEAMRSAGIPRLTLSAKEGLALTNGAAFATAMLALACLDTQHALLVSGVAAAMTMDAMMAAGQAFDARIHNARQQPGQIRVASQLRRLLSGSQLIDAGGRLQDAYSLRCTPQVVGPAWDTLEFAQQVVTRELNAVTDNPLFFGDEVLSGGNFHGEPVGLAADYLKIALSEVGALSERRVYRLMSEDTNFGLPPMLVGRPDEAGLHSGLMILQYTAAALVLENENLASPDSVHSLPTSAGQEDHNANATTAARHLMQVLENLQHILAIELIAAAQAVDLRLQQSPELRLGAGTHAAHQVVRKAVPFISADTPLSEYIEKATSLIRSGDLLDSLSDLQD